MLETIALGKWAIFARLFRVIVGNPSDSVECWFELVLRGNAMNRSIAIRLMGEGR